MTQIELEAAFIMLNAEMAAEKAALDKNNPRLTEQQRRDVLEGINRRYAIRKAKLVKEPIAHNPDRKCVKDLYRLREYLKKAIEDFRSCLWQSDCPTITFTREGDITTFSIRIEKVPS